MTKLRIAQSARDDLRDIRIYSKATFGPRVARRYLEDLQQAFALLRERPRAGRVEPDLGSGVRGIGFRSHRIYYRTYDEEVVILRILHHAQDVVSAWTNRR